MHDELTLDDDSHATGRTCPLLIGPVSTRSWSHTIHSPVASLCPGLSSAPWSARASSLSVELDATTSHRLPSAYQCERSLHRIVLYQHVTVCVASIVHTREGRELTAAFSCHLQSRDCCCFLLGPAGLQCRKLAKDLAGNNRGAPDCLLAEDVQLMLHPECIKELSILPILCQGRLRRRLSWAAVLAAR